MEESQKKAARGSSRAVTASGSFFRGETWVITGARLHADPGDWRQEERATVSDKQGHLSRFWDRDVGMSQNQAEDGHCQISRLDAGQSGSNSIPKKGSSGSRCKNDNVHSSFAGQ